MPSDRFTLGDIRNDIAEMLAVCRTDDRVATYVNEAQSRLMIRGKWVGAYNRFRVCLNNGCITWPREIETIEAFSACDWPAPVRNEWYEFNEHGWGLQSDDSCPGSMLIDRGEACAYDDITISATDRKIKVYSDIQEATSYITLQGYDQNGQWIRTFVSGAWIDGENVNLASAYPNGVLTTNFFRALVAVLKPVTLGNIRLYEYNTSLAANAKSLAVYEPDETRPIYRRSLVPGLSDSTCCVSSDSADCDSARSVVVMAKLRHIPVSDDNDWLMLRSPAAIRLGVMAILKEKKDLLPEAETYWGKAIAELERGLQSYQGDGAISTPRVAPSSTWGGAIETFNGEYARL